MIALPIDPTLTRSWDVVADPLPLDWAQVTKVDLDAPHAIIQLHSASEAQAVAAALAALGPQLEATDISRATIRARMLAAQAFVAMAEAMADRIEQDMGLDDGEHQELIDAIFNGNARDVDRWLDDCFDEDDA